MAQISASPRKYFIRANGTPAAGGTLQIYDANTTTNALTWFDQDGASNHQNANPLTLDAQGSCIVWMEAGKSYDWIAKDSLGNTIEDTKDISGASSAIMAPSPWIVTGITPTFVNTRTFTLVGNQTAEFHAGRRIRVQVTAGTRYATIMSSVFSTLTTIVLGFQNTTDALDAGLSAVDFGLSPADNPMDMVGKGSIIDLTGYSGPDVALGIGQSAFYGMTATASLLLRLVAGDNQEFEIKLNPTAAAGSDTGPPTTLSMNNAPLGTSFWAIQAFQYAAGVGLATQYGNRTQTESMPLSVGLKELGFLARVCTRTNGKTSFSSWISTSTTNFYSGHTHVFCTDVTTAWTSLGTITFPNQMAGRVVVTRLM